ncbi:MAG TPA: TonB-dependent receptor [Myxococcales bacterium]|nr:TonB-dependent receptor [Myxococcales bacterium]
MEPAWRAANARCGCVLAAALLLAAPARAEDPPGAAGEADGGSAPGYGEEIEVQGHYQNAVGTSEAASAGTITRKLVEDRPILRPGEVLELVPGLIITQHSGAGKANQYFLRGFNLDHGTDFLTTLDGVPLNLRTHAHGQGYTDLNFLIPELIQRVQYFKGPYFASKGDFASAGAAEIRLVDSLPKNLVELTGGSSLYGRALFAGSPDLFGGKLLYAFELFHEDGPWVHPDDYRRLNGVLRYSQTAGEASWAITAMGYYGLWNATDQVPLRAVESGEIDRFGTLDPTSGGTTHRFSLSADYRADLGDALLQANVHAVKYRLDLFSNFTYFLFDPVNGDQFEQMDDRWQLGTSGHLSWTARESAIALRVTGGWEARHDRIDPVGLYHTAARERLATIRKDFVRETSGGLFLEGEAALTSWLRAIAGARYDQYWFDVISDEAANSGRESAGRLSPKLSAILGPFAQTELFANFGFGFHSNDARGVTAAVDPTSGALVSKSPPLVQTRGGELGVRTGLVPGVQSSLALWRLDLDSELLFTGDAGTTEPSRPSRRMGIEWNTRWQPIRWLLFDLDVSWSRARFTTVDPITLGDHIPGAIESAVSAGATIQKAGPWTASVYLRYFGPRPLSEDDRVRSTASAIFNGQVSCQVAAWAKVSLEIFNLLDAPVDDIAYFYVSRLRTDPACSAPPGGANGTCGTAGIHFHPAEKRSFRLTGAFTF